MPSQSSNSSPSVPQETLRETLRALAAAEGPEQIAATRSIPSREGTAVPFPGELHPDVAASLQAAGITALYSHQRQVWALAKEGRHVVMATPTASGKSLAFNLPVFDTLCRCPEATALYLFPTKALARDQLAALRAHWPGDGKEVDVYDGDTAVKKRRAIRSRCRLLITNPDMLHTALLPHHPSWHRFFSGLAHVVVDEVHQYRGVIGSHAANVFRRMRRICRFYGASPGFIAASATVANPAELMGRLTATDPEAVADSGAPAGRREFVFFNPPIVDRERGLREGSRSETVRIVLPFLRAGHRVIVFARSRRETEVIHAYLRESLEGEGLPADWVCSYRGGHLAAERRAVEADLREGRVRAVVTTTALELGIDIGGLDLAVLSGYPGSIAGTWQQAGRAGRGRDDSACILVAGNSPLDQYIVSHPDYFFGQPPERAALDPANPHVIASHLACGAFELPLEDGEVGPKERELLSGMAEEGKLHCSDGRWHWVGGSYPAAEVGLRSASPGALVLVDGEGSTIGTVDGAGAPLAVHEGAVYFHGGLSYVVEKLDREGGRALLHRRETDYLTEPVVRFTVVEGGPLLRNSRGAVEVRLVPLELTTGVTGFRRIQLFSHEYLGEEEIEPVESLLLTEGCAIEVPCGTGALAPAELQAGAYLLSRVAPLYVLSDAGDVGSSWRIEEGRRGVIYLYDRCPGGVGYGRRIFENCGKILRAAVEVAGECPCPRGCPSCLGPRPGASRDRKAAAVDFLGDLAGAVAGEDDD